MSKTPDIIQIIQREMFDDDDNMSDRLIEIYNDADDVGKKLIDDVLICVCGWSFGSLKEKAIQEGCFVGD